MPAVGAAGEEDSMTEVDPEVGQLRYWRDRTEKRSWMARMTVLVAVVGLLILNTYLLFLSSDAVILNIDQARLEQTALTERLEARIGELEGRIGELEAEQEARHRALVARVDTSR